MALSMAFAQYPPTGDAFALSELAKVIGGRNSRQRLTETLRGQLGPVEVELFASGREAMRRAFVECAERTGRSAVLIPAYCCYSIPASARAAGLDVRLIDVGPNAALDPKAVERAPMELAAAVVVGNLFGIPEPISRIRELARLAGTAVIDDAAQALGARDSDGRVGSRSELAILSFGRGKPLSGLGGGAICRRVEATSQSASEGPATGSPAATQSPTGRSRLSAVLQALAYNAVRLRLVFPWVARIPQLKVGHTVYDPKFRRGAIAESNLALVAAAVDRFQERARVRALAAEHLATAISASSAFAPLIATGTCVGVYPRLALLAPSESARDRALETLAKLGAGASRMYPQSLDQLEALQAEGGEPCPGARDLARRILTLPARPLGHRQELAIVEALNSLALGPARDCVMGLVK